MILAKDGNDIVQVREALLKRRDGTKIRYYSTSENVIEYLQEQPDVDFLLEAKQLGEVLTGTNAPNYGPARGDIFTGQIKYDSATKKIIQS
ncbi:MAG: hypothetical protein AB7O68_00605 [Pirellulales bacterium]